MYRVAKDLLILDDHCHLSPKGIYADCPFDNIGEIRLFGDHYKWRLMRIAGIDGAHSKQAASFITGVVLPVDRGFFTYSGV